MRMMGNPTFAQNVATISSHLIISKAMVQNEHCSKQLRTLVVFPNVKVKDPCHEIHGMQMRYLKKSVDKEQSAQSRNPLVSVIELQKSVLPGFVREITCNNLPTFILFTDQQIDNIVRFCCSKNKGFVSELGVDLIFQLGPFYLLVTTFKDTLLKVKGSEHSPTFVGPMMICMTKDQQTYLSFVHRLVREVPGLSKFLHAYGTDSEDALTNALAAGFPSSAHLLCYIHCKKNVQEKCKQIANCLDLFGRHGLLWCQSSELFVKQTTQLVEKWDALESNERKKQDMKSKMCRFVVTQDMDKLIMSLYELIGSFDEEEELAWFGLSEKWEVRAEYQHLRPKGFSNMTPDQRQGEITKMRKIRPDATAYNNCKSFKFSSPQASEQSRDNWQKKIVTHILVKKKSWREYSIQGNGDLNHLPSKRFLHPDVLRPTTNHRQIFR
ncbi:Hypothetical predicted protein, partial [Paramuricea clavata]